MHMFLARLAATAADGRGLPEALDDHRLAA